MLCTALAASSPAFAQAPPPAPPSAVPAAAQPVAPPATGADGTFKPESGSTPSSSFPGFGQRDAFVLSFENVLGFMSQTTGSDNREESVASAGTIPSLIWGDIGLFGVSEGGFTYGALVGVEHWFLKGDDLTILRLRPRIGYGTSFPKARRIGVWLRTGPSWMVVFEGDTRLNYLAWSIDGFIVVKPAEHVGILCGPTADIHLIGRDNHGNSEKYQVIGLSVGLLGEF